MEASTFSTRRSRVTAPWLNPGFTLSQGQPVIPSKVAKRLYQIEAELHRVLDLSSNGKLASLGVNMAAYGRLSYVQRVEEYPALQQIGEVAFFHEYQAVIVPSARWPGSNVVIMTEHAALTQLEIVADEPVDLGAWALTNRVKG